MTLYHGSSFWACLKGTICSQNCCFSRRKSAEKAGVVVITTFLFKDLEIEATTGSLIPFSEKALLKAFLVASGEKLVFELVFWMRMSRFVVFGRGFGFF